MNEMITTSEQHRAIKQELNIRQWSTIIQDRQNSGMSIKSYCEQHGLTEGSYYYWQKVVRKKACSTFPDIGTDASAAIYSMVETAQALIERALRRALLHTISLKNNACKMIYKMIFY